MAHTFRPESLSARHKHPLSGRNERKPGTRWCAGFLRYSRAEERREAGTSAGKNRRLFNAGGVLLLADDALFYALPDSVSEASRAVLLDLELGGNHAAQSDWNDLRRNIKEPPASNALTRKKGEGAWPPVSANRRSAMRRWLLDSP